LHFANFKGLLMLNSAANTSSNGPFVNPRSFAGRQSQSSSTVQQRNINVIASMRHHWAASLCVFFVILGSGTFILWKKAKPVYDTQSVVYISPKFPKVLNDDSEVERHYDTYFQDQIQTVTRYDIIAEAIASLPYSVRHRSGSVLPSEIEALQHTIEAKRIGTSYEMSVGLSGPSPSGLAEIVNAVTDSYVDRTKNEEFYGLGDRLKTLHQEKDRLRKEIDDRLAEQAHLMGQLGVASISTEVGTTNPYDATSSTVRSQLATARIQREAAEAHLNSLQQRNKSGNSNALDAASETIAADPGLAAILSALSSHRAAVLLEMSGLRSDHPIYQKDKDDLSSTDSHLNDLNNQAAEQVQNKARREVERTRMVELKLTKELEDKTNAATSAAPKYLRASELGPEIDSLQRAFEAISNRIRDLELESNTPGSIHVSTKAHSPTSQEQTKLPIYALGVILMCLAAATAIPVGIDLLDHRIYAPRDIEQVVGFHPMGVLVDEGQLSGEVAGEYYLRLAAGIDHAVRRSGARVFLFTSLSHGAGTSTIVRKLSEQLRRLQLRTRTITAATSGELQVPLSGISSSSEMPRQEWKTFDDVRQTTLTPDKVAYNHPRYHLQREVPPPNPVEWTLYHAGMEYDVVLIDAQPIPISAQTEYLARLADATVLVIKASGTTTQELDRAARLLERIEVAGVAVILNKVRVERADRALKREFRSYGNSLKQFSEHPETTPGGRPAEESAEKKPAPVGD
jgi:uncharacterized protein involved in exopolysaccharide biosynthesis